MRNISFAADPELGNFHEGPTLLRDDAVRCQVIDRLRQDLREMIGEILLRDTGLLGQLLQQVRTDHPLNVRRRNRIVRSGADPRLYGLPESIALEFVDDALHAAVLLQNAVHDSHHAGADDATKYSVEESHTPPSR